MRAVYSTRGDYEKCILNFSRKPEQKTSLVADLEVDEMIALK